MTAQLDVTEFATLDLAELDEAALVRAVYLPTFAHQEWRHVLAAALPTVASAHAISDSSEEHEFIDMIDGAAVRLVLSFDPRTRNVVAHIAEAGPAGLWDRIIGATTAWDRDGRPEPQRP